MSGNQAADSHVNPYAEIFEACGYVKDLKALCNSDTTGIAQMASDLMSTYFTLEKTDNENSMAENDPVVTRPDFSFED